MQRLMCWGKIHRATVTGANVEYVGSITIDEDLLDAASILPYELVHVYDITNAARLETYTVPAPRKSGIIEMNGAAAKLIHKGDLVIIVNYVWMEEKMARIYKPRIILVDKKNRPAGKKKKLAGKKDNID
jgi:aspartate 1-decarboxylase